MTIAHPRPNQTSRRVPAQRFGSRPEVAVVTAEAGDAGRLPGDAAPEDLFKAQLMALTFLADTAWQ
jgi:hypothetical protein